MKKYTLEICADSVESALIAAEHGADRVELCSNMIIGGTTPSQKLFEGIRKYSDIDIRVLIRPRYGDFFYSKYELDIMREEIAMFTQMGAEGIVTGVLSCDGNLDREAMEYVLGNRTETSKVTLHRAFDMCSQPLRAMEDAVDIGVDTILTSGQQNNCIKGLDLLAQLKLAAGDRIDILVGSGVNSDNVVKIWKATGITSFHLSAKEIIESNMKFRNPNINMGIKGFNEYSIYRTSGTEVDKVIRKLEGL